MTVVNAVDYFEELRHLENSKLPNHKLTLSVLKAADQGIVKRGLALTADNYYMAIWPLLFHPPSSSSTATDQDWIGCILGLVARFISFVDITAERYSEMYAGLSQCDSTWSLIAVKSAIICAARLLTGFQDRESSVELFRQLLLSNCIDARPKVRKQAHESMLVLLPGLNDNFRDELLQLVITVMQESSRKDCHNTLHLLRLLKRAIPVVNMSSSREEELLAAMKHCLSLGNVHLSCSCFDVLELLSLTHDHESQLSATIYLLLKRNRPEDQEAESLVPWLLAFSQAACQYGARDAIINGLDVIFEVVQSNRDDILIAGRTAIEYLLASKTINTFALEDYERIAASLNPRINVKKFDSFHPATLDICMLVFTAFSKHLLPSFSSTIQLLAMLHDRKGFKMQTFVERILQDVCRFVGVDGLLNLVPLKLADGSYKNGWMIGVLTKGCFNDSLLTFKQRLLPLNEQLISKARKYLEEGKTLEAKTLETVANQVLSCFGAFLRFPTDFDCEFDDQFAQTCAGWLNSNISVRPIICGAISEMINSLTNFAMDVDSEEGKKFPRHFSAEMAEKCLEVFGGLAPKFLPVLFNICISSPPEHRSFILKCIQSLLSCSDHQLVHEYFDKLVARIPQIQDSEQSTALLDIAGALVTTGVIPEQSLSRLLSIAQQGLDSPDGHIQKRSYRILLILGQREEHMNLLASNEQLLCCLMDNAINCDPSARKLRFKVLVSLDLSKIHSNVPLSTFVPSILPEVVLGTKEINSKTRQSAFDLIIQWGRHFQINGSLDDYVYMNMAGLAAKTPSMMAGSFLALARLVFEFKDQILSVDQLLDDAIIVLSSPTREVVKAAIGFIKVAILALDKAKIEPKLAAILSGLLVWGQEHAQHFKSRVRHIVERLIRQHGYDRVKGCCPQEHVKLLENIQLIKQRRAKRKQSAQATNAATPDSNQQQQIKKPFDEAMFGDESEDELLAEDDMELVNDDDVDVIQTTMSRKLSFKSMKSVKSFKSTKSNMTGRQKDRKPTSTQPDLNSQFRTNKKTGKLIINESEEEVEVDAVANHHDITDADFYAMKKKKRQRQLHPDSDEDDTSGPDNYSVRTGSKSMALSKASIKSNTLSKAQARKKQRGDALRSGCLEPYAYVPLARKKQIGKKNKYFTSK